MDSHAHDILDIAEHLYAAATQGTPWQDACVALTHSFGGHTAAMFLDRADAIVPITFPGFTDHALRLYAEHYNRVDPWAQVARQLRPQRRELSCLLGHDHVPMTSFENSEIWQDFSRHQVGAFHLLGSSFNLDDGSHAVLGLHRPRDAGAFEPGDVQRMRLLLPHLRNALFLAHRMETAESLATAGLAALEHCASGIAIMNGAGQILFANAALERLAASGAFHMRSASGPGWSGQPARLCAALAADQSRLALLIDHASRLGAGGAMQLGGAGAETRLAVFIMPLPGRLSPQAAGRAGIFDSGKVLAIIRDHARPVPLDGGVLKAIYGFSDAEVVVAQLLLGGRSAEAVAAERGVSLPTIRAQIRHILDKSGARSLRELEGMLAAP